MKRPRRIVVGIAVLAAAMAAGVWVYVEYISWPDPPPHLAGRLPAARDLPPGLTHQQRQAIRLLYSWHSGERSEGVRRMEETGVPRETQTKWLIALLIDDPKSAPDPPISATEAWVRKLLGRDLKSADVGAEVYGLLAARLKVAEVVQALHEEPHPEIRLRLLALLRFVSGIDNNGRSYVAPEVLRWILDPKVLDVAIEVLKTDKDGRVREAALRVYSDGLCRARDRYPIDANRDPLRIDMSLWSDDRLPIDPEHRRAILAAADADPAYGPRAEAMRLVAEQMGPECYPHLLRALGEANDDARFMAAVMLKDLGSRIKYSKGPERPAVIEALLAALRSAVERHSPPGTYHIAAALRDLTDQDFIYDVDQWQAWYEEHKAEFSAAP